MAFKFPLATVLRVRILREEREERLLQQILFQVSHVSAQIHAVDAQLDAANVRRARHVFAAMKANQVQDHSNEVVYLRQSRKGLEQTLENLEDMRDRQLAAYHAARRDRKMLSEMRERQQTLHALAASREEQRSVDEYFAMQHSRRADRL